MFHSLGVSTHRHKVSDQVWFSFSEFPCKKKGFSHDKFDFAQIIKVGTNEETSPGDKYLYLVPWTFHTKSLRYKSQEIVPSVQTSLSLWDKSQGPNFSPIQNVNTSFILIILVYC